MKDPTRCDASEARDDHRPDPLRDAPPAELNLPGPIPQTVQEVADAVVQAFPHPTK